MQVHVKLPVHDPQVGVQRMVSKDPAATKMDRLLKSRASFKIPGCADRFHLRRPLPMPISTTLRHGVQAQLKESYD